MEIITQIQKWKELTRVLLVADGVASVQLELYDTEQKFGGKAWAYALWVNKESRRKGYARALLAEVERVAAELGHESIVIDWKEKDTPRAVLRWYKRLGYDDIAFSGRGDYVLLKKELKPTAE